MNRRTRMHLLYDDDSLFTLRETSRYMKWSDAETAKRMASGEIPFIRVGKQFYMRKGDLDHYAQRVYEWEVMRIVQPTGGKAEIYYTRRKLGDWIQEICFDHQMAAADLFQNAR